MKGCEVVVGKRGITAQGINNSGNAAPDREIQRKVNELMGVSEEIYAQFANNHSNNDAVPQGDIQKMVNKLMGLSEGIFNKYNK